MPDGGYAKYSNKEIDKQARAKLDQEMEDVLQMLRERCKRTVLRKIESGEVTYDKSRKMFIYKESQEEYKVEHKGDNDSSDSDGSDSEPETKGGKVMRPKPEGASEDESEEEESEEEKLETIKEGGKDEVKE